MTNLFKNIFGTPFKHKKLSDDWANLQSSVSEGVTFACRDLGSTVVTQAQNVVATAEAIRRVIHLVRATHTKPKRVTLHVSSKGVKVQCTETGEVVRDTDIYDIAYCSADSQYNHVIAFITNGERNVFDCFAYLCQSSKMAQTVSLAIAHAFNIAYNEKWQAEHDDEIQKITNEDKSNGIEKNLIEIESTDVCTENGIREATSNVDQGTETASAKSDVCFNDFNSENPWFYIIQEDKRRMSSTSSKNNSLKNWTSFDDNNEQFVENSLSSLELNDVDKQKPLISTKPPQRCKASDTSNSTPKLTLAIAKPLEMPLKKSKPVEMPATQVVVNASSQRSISEGPFPASDLFCEFENLWKSKSETFDWETFGNNSPTSSSFSLSLCQSPTAPKLSGTSEWTSFTE